MKERIRTCNGVPALPAPFVSFLHSRQQQLNACQRHGSENQHDTAPAPWRLEALENLFSLPAESHLEAAAFWRHAFLCARLTAAIAKSLKSPWQPLAFEAGLFHDIGKAALAMLTPEPFAAALHQVQAQGAFVLEAERRELSVDHALAGKWLAEAWDLPEAVRFAIWLHHHPAKALAHTDYPLPLIDMVSLANLLAHRHGAAQWSAGHSAVEAEERRRRLGLPLDQLKSILEEAREDPAARPEASSLEAPEAAPGEEARRLQDRLHCYEVLHRLHLGAAETRSQEALLKVMVSALRDAFAIRSGCCYLVDRPGEVIRGAIWRGRQGGVEAIQLSLHTQKTPPERDEPFFATLFRKLIRGENQESELNALLRGHGMMMLPIARAGTLFGQILFDADASSLRGDGRFMPELEAFSEACAQALLVQQTKGALEQECEDLSGALWRQELTHKETLREERLAAIGRMAAGAAHEINNPLAAISGRAQMLLSKATQSSEIRALDAIVEQSRRINKIVSDLMQFARPADPKLEECQLSYILHQVLASMRSRIEGKGIRLYEEYAAHLPPVRLDRHQIAQAFTNIVLNAEEAMESTGGSLRLSMRASQDGRSIITEIADSGPGVPPAIAHKVFEPFFTTRESNENTGLGLAVCYGVIEGHRGAISVRNNPDQGATFTMTLPVTQSGAAAPAATPPAKESAKRPQEAPAQTPITEKRSRPEIRIKSDLYAPTPQEGAAKPSPRDAQQETPPQTPGIKSLEKSAQRTPPSAAPAAAAAPASMPQRVLVVERDETLREVLRSCLEQQGYAVRSVSDGLEAMATALAYPLDLILLELGLTGVDGGSLVEQLVTRFPKVTIVGVAGVGNTAAQEEARELGVSLCFEKPFRIEEVLTHLRTHFASREVA